VIPFSSPSGALKGKKNVWFASVPRRKRLGYGKTADLNSGASEPMMYSYLCIETGKKAVLAP
jgi:hypothetical protein